MELSQIVEELACHVYESLGSGHREEVYKNALLVGLRLRAVPYESERIVDITYQGHHVGEGYADIVVDKKLVVELKAVQGKLGPAEEQQLRNYLAVLDAEHGLLINFQCPGGRSAPKLEIRRVERNYKDGEGEI